MKPLNIVLKHLKTASRINPDIKVQDLNEDKFIHFTTKQNAKDIIESGKILLDPPNRQGTGIHAVVAISLIWGRHVPNVQTNRLPKDDRVAITFKTNTKPDYGYVEEVIWHKDVPLKDPKVISYDEGIKLLNSAPEKIDEDTEVNYK
jgi:hypothetical protein